MKRKEDHPVRTWVEIDKKAIAHNYRVFRKLIGKRTMLMGVVKSNAYGHNLMEFAKELESRGADWLGVDSLVEGLSVRERGVETPILVLGYTIPALFEMARAKDISVTISSFESLEVALALPRGKRPLRVHLKLDTGMHRQGFQPADVDRLLGSFARVDERSIVVEGAFTHFAEAKEPRSGHRTREQIARFEKMTHALREAGFDPIIHAAATGGAMLYPSAHYDMVRIGIGLYGLWPSSECERFLSSKIELRPALSWRAIVGEVKDVAIGERVGYDFTELLTRNSRLAVIPVGYWHGFPRMLSSKGRVLVCGKTARVVGRVSMDMIVVDVTDIPKAKAGAIVTLIGRDGKETIKAKELADLSSTTHYEIVTRLNPLMKKVYE